MYNRHRNDQFAAYRLAREKFCQDPSKLLGLEEFLSGKIVEMLSDNMEEICGDYNEATFLYPFWQAYPPEKRGRQPKGDQFPWMEVGEHVLGAKLCRYIDD